MAASDSLPIPIKNTAYRIYFPMFDADGDMTSGATIDSGLASGAGKALVSKDAGVAVNSTNSVTEVSGAGGGYFLDLTAAEMNFDCLFITVRTTTAGVKNTPIVLNPQESGDIKVQVQDVAANAITAAGLATDAGAEIADAVWDELKSGHSIADSFGDYLDDEITSRSALASDADITAIKTKTDFLPSAAAGGAGGVFIAGTNAATAITGALTANVTGNLSGSVGSVVGAVGSVAGAVASVTGSVGSVAGNVSGNVSGSVGSVVGHTPQTGDSFARIGATGSGLTSLATQTLLTTVAGYVDAEIGAIIASLATIDGKLPATLLAGRIRAHIEALDVAAFTSVVIQAVSQTVGSVTAGVTLANDAVSAAQFAQTAADKVWTSANVRAQAIDNIDASISSRATPGDVNTQVLTALGAFIITELAAGAPVAAPTIGAAIALMYSIARNKLTDTSTELTLFDSAGAPLAKQVLSQAAGTFTREQLGAP